MTDFDDRFNEKYCRYCGKKLERQFFAKSNSWESPSQYNRRVYCNKDCARKGSFKYNPNQTLRNTHITARKVFRVFSDADCCELCGKMGKLDVHHVDHNEHNNNKSNLQLLCRSCHMKLHLKKGVCKVEGCDSLVKGLGYCNKHYKRYKKYGDPLIRKTQREKQCCVCGKIYIPKARTYRDRMVCSDKCKGILNEIIKRKNCTQIIQLNMDGEIVALWESQREIQKKLGFYQSNICKCCKGKTLTAYGYIWKYANNVLNMKREQEE